jgi:hypothetical protein
MRASRVAILILAGTAVAGLSACNSIRSAVGASKVTPDEFRVVSIAPLTVPPDYALRPPTPGEPRPQELDPSSTAREILLGAREGVTRSASEQALVDAAGADSADPLARYVIDDEFGDLAHKDENWAQRLMFWRSDDPSTQGPTTTGGGDLVIDAAREQERLAALTGGQAIVIQRDSGGIKLPGL